MFSVYVTYGGTCRATAVAGFCSHRCPTVFKLNADVSVQTFRRISFSATEAWTGQTCKYQLQRNRLSTAGTCDAYPKALTGMAPFELTPSVSTAVQDRSSVKLLQQL